MLAPLISLLQILKNFTNFLLTPYIVCHVAHISKCTIATWWGRGACRSLKETFLYLTSWVSLHSVDLALFYLDTHELPGLK